MQTVGLNHCYFSSFVLSFYNNLLWYRFYEKSCQFSCSSESFHFVHWSWVITECCPEMWDFPPIDLHEYQNVLWCATTDNTNYYEFCIMLIIFSLEFKNVPSSFTQIRLGEHVFVRIICSKLKAELRFSQLLCFWLYFS